MSTLEKQQYVHTYIDISPYRDTLGSDTVSIDICVSRIDILNIVIYRSIDIKTVYLYVRTVML